jgi:hypothetical protein
VPKGKIFKTSLLILMLASYLHVDVTAIANDTCGVDINIATNPGNANYTPGWRSQCPPEVVFEFDDDSTPDIITSGGSIDVYVKGGSAPFTYTVTSGTGATWNASGSTSRSSNNRKERLDLADGT